MLWRMPAYSKQPLRNPLLRATVAKAQADGHGYIWPMKKIFPLIIVLIFLSVVGIVILQISWVRNLLRVQEVNMLYKAQIASLEVANELSRQVGSSQGLRLNRINRLMPPNMSINTRKPPTISQRYTDREIQQMLLKAFANQGLHDLKFEFAITNAVGQIEEVELQSPDFYAALLDTNYSITRIYPIAPEQGSDFEGLTMAEEQLHITIPEFQKQLIRSVQWMLVGAALFSLVILAAFYISVRTLLEQKKLSEIKSDFINNMTHEFKTPLATISLAVDMVRNKAVQANPEKLSYFSDIIKEENKRMNKHVETILQAAVMDRQELKINLRPLNVHPIIEEIASKFTLQLQDKNGRIELLLNAAHQTIHADEVHFTNMINNLVDNAVKYSNDEVLIKISTHSSKKRLLIRVADNGIGMSKETVKRIFEKFYRAHTGNVHNVKGFGLGMSYVKSIVDAHKGRIRVESIQGKGSTFTVELPMADDLPDADV